MYAAYNWYGSNAAGASVGKSIIEYGYNGHEGGQAFHERTQLGWLAERLEG